MEFLTEGCLLYKEFNYEVKEQYKITIFLLM